MNPAIWFLLLRPYRVGYRGPNDDDDDKALFACVLTILTIAVIVIGVVVTSALIKANDGTEHTTPTSTPDVPVLQDAESRDSGVGTKNLRPFSTIRTYISK